VHPRNSDAKGTGAAAVAPLLTAAEVQSLLRISRAQTYALLATTIPVVHLGRSLRVRPETFASWLEAQERIAGETV
jgi:hypothetical protein